MNIQDGFDSLPLPESTLKTLLNANQATVIVDFYLVKLLTYSW